jgi:PPOX class probable F420-dependent enzyme
MFSQQERALLDLPAFARLATLMPDGAPQLTVMWFRRDGYSLRMIAPANTRKARNLEHDPRVAVIVEEPGNSYHFVEIRGTVEIVRDDSAARTELERIAERYIGDRARDYAAGLSADPRILLVVHPEKTVYHPGGG